MRRSFVAIAIAVGTLITACGGDSPSGGYSNLDAEIVNLPDGSTVVCVHRSGGGVDCDWDRR